MDTPNASSLTDVVKKGHLQKLASRSFPYIQHQWKRKYCVLVPGLLCFYDRDDARGADKGSGVVNLEYFDQVLEAGPKEAKKASHAFVITSQDRTFFDPGRHLFSADSAASMSEWMKLIQKAIEQTRNNNKTKASVAAAAAAAALNQSNSVANTRSATGSKPSPKSAEVAAKDKKAAAGAEPDENKAKKRLSAADADKGAENKENNKDWTAPDERKAKSSESSLRRRKPGAGGRTTEDEAVDTDNSKNFYSLQRKKPEAAPTPTGSLGRKSNPKTTKPGAEETQGSKMGGKSKEIGKKRKADDEGLEDGGDVPMEVPDAAGQLESVTKNRVRGPAGRRMPQHRRTHLIKHRASSLSALAHTAADVSNPDNPTNSFVPWLNRSLDLLGEDDLLQPSRNSQPALAYMYPDQEDLDDMALMYDPHSAAFGENISFDDNSMGIYIDDGFSNMNLSAGGIPPPLPPRLESRMEFVANPANPLQMQNAFQLQQHNHLQQHLQQMHYQASRMQNPNQMSSPFGTLQEDKQKNRKSQPESNIELFVSSYSEENSCDGLQGNPEGTQQRRNPQQMRPRSAGAKSTNGQRQRRGGPQPDMGRFTSAVRNLQKHVVELDQAVNEITREVEDSKADLGSVKSGLMAVKKDKEKLSDAVSIVSQEAAKMKEQVTAALKEAEKLQKTATAALVVAEKAKIDQQNLKKEYENLLRHMKSTITALKKEALKASISAPSSLIYQKLHGDSSDRDDGSDQDDECIDDDEDYEDEEKKRQEKVKDSGKKHGFFSRPSSIISGLTNRSSLTKSSTSLDAPEKEKNKDSSHSPNKNREKRDKESKLIDKMTKKDTGKKNKGAAERGGRKSMRNVIDDFPMIDDTSSPRALSPVRSTQDLSSPKGSLDDLRFAKSTSPPLGPSRPRKLNLKPQKSDLSQKGNSSPDSPTRALSPFDIPKMTLNGRAASPTGFAALRPGSTPGPLSRQGSMTTVPEDRAVDTRTFDNRPSDPPPPPPQAGKTFAISRQSSSPNIATQKTGTSTLQKQRSLGVLLEESKNPISRQSSTVSMTDDRPIVDQTLPMSPASSLMSFPGSWSTTSLNRPDSAAGFDGPDEFPRAVTSPKLRSRGPLEQVAGAVLSGSNLQASVVHPLDESGAEPPLATSSLKKRKKVKKDPVHV